MAHTLLVIIVSACFFHGGAQQYAAAPAVAPAVDAAIWTPPAADPAVVAANAALLPLATNQAAPTAAPEGQWYQRAAAAAPPVAAAPVVHTPYTPAAPVAPVAPAAPVSPVVAAAPKAAMKAASMKENPRDQKQPQKQQQQSPQGRGTLANGTCAWPHCLPRCEECPGSPVGRCWFSYVSDAFGCSKLGHLANSSCFLGRCLCKPGHCATTDNLGATTCTPHKCHLSGGPHPPPYVPSNWVNFWTHFSDRAPFPAPEYMNDHASEYVASIMILPVFLVTFGFIMALLTGYCICCGPTGHHFIKGKKGKDNYGTDDEFSDEDSALLQKGGRKPATRPRIRWLVVLAVLVVLTTSTAVLKRNADMTQLHDLLETMLGHVHRDATTVATEAVGLNTSVGNFLDNLDNFVNDCTLKNGSIIQPLVASIKPIVEDDLRNLKRMIRNYSGMVVHFPQQISEAREMIISNNAKISTLPSLPIVTLALICLFIVGEAVMTAKMGTSCCACVDNDWCLRGSAVLFVFIILTLAAVLGILSAFGVGLSSFCMDPDRNAMAYVKYSQNVSTTSGSTVAGATSYYLAGQTLNPAVNLIAMGKKYCMGIDSRFHSLKPVFSRLESVCNSSHDVNITTLTVAAIGVFDMSENLLKARNVWPFYENAVRIGVCRLGVASLGVTVVAQFVVGLVLFPLCAIMSHKFFVEWSTWEAGGDSWE